jgi:preprotein translocase subunit YajC
MGVVQDGTCFAFVIVGVEVFFNVFMAIMLFLSTKQQKKRQLQKLFEK